MKVALGRKTLFTKVVGNALLYDLLVWNDGVVIQFTNPMRLAVPASHLLIWMRTDIFTALSFLVSAFGFFM